MGNRFRLEAGQAAVEHGEDHVREMVGVAARGEKGLDGELFEPAKGLRLGRAAHDGDHLGRELEGGALEADAAGGDVKAEAKVNVQDVAGVVNHDVAVVPVLELQQVADHAVGGHALDKVAPRFLKRNRLLAAKLGQKVVVQPVDGFAAEHVARHGIREHVDDTAAGRGRGDAVREDIAVQPDAVEDAPKDGNHLQRQHVLSAVVSDLEDSRLPHFVSWLIRCNLGTLVFGTVIPPFQSLRIFLLSNAKGCLVRCLCMALQWRSRLSINPNDNPVWIAGQVNT